MHHCYGLKRKVCYRRTLSLLGMDLHHAFLTASWERVELLASMQLIFGRTGEEAGHGAVGLLQQ